MKITINGKGTAHDRTDITLAELLVINKVAAPHMVTVQLNGGFVAGDKYESIFIKDGDEVDFLYFMGGGR
ncbi:MAG: sulfur carrier protein ThiS [Candidatus Omnitrophica bacterium]|nr:sulfur carrier protein ThiS [Candidatus Omnitrophota bacterium]